jgi:hypothetical protein
VFQKMAVDLVWKEKEISKMGRFNARFENCL